ncbi:MAG: Coat domain [Paenibacillus sp.]|jgi:similar to spore coat protein|nr:Coat domain [Paenibacillus sp.]
MNTTVQSVLNDQAIATDMLITAKCSVKDISVALTEAASPQVRTFLKLGSLI